MSLRPFAAIVAACLLAITVAACDNTVRGAGQDIQDTADAVEDTVN